jgi:zinc protease
LKPDAQAVFGQLDNGLRYVILPNTTPPGRASLRLYMNVGSLMEADDQQGMAHFLEHMAFNGTRHFAAGEMVKYFQRLGMSFGAHTNAFTMFDRTVYQLDMPKVDQSILTDGLKLIRDYLDGMLLEPAEIDKERGVILSENLSRDSAELRAWAAGLQFGLPDSLLPHRIVFGKESTIKAMQRKRFVDFYETYYTPKRAVVVAVGDFPHTAAVKRLIETYFADAKPRRGDAPGPNLGKVTTGRGLVAKLHTDREAAAVDVSIDVRRPAKNARDSIARQHEAVVQYLANSMFNERLSKLVKVENSPVMSASSYHSQSYKLVDQHGVSARCKPEQWKPALKFLEQELRRVLQFGFADAEFDQAKASYLQLTKQLADQASTRESANLADEIVSLVADDKVFTHPAYDLALVQGFLSRMSKDACVAALRAGWNTKDINVFISGNLKLSGDPAAAIVAVYRESAGQPVAAPAKEQSADFAYASFGAPGKIATRSEIKDLEITQVVFENNVRVNLKRTPFKKNVVIVAINFGGGGLEAPKDKPGLMAFTASTFIEGGLEMHSLDDINRWLANRSAGVQFTVSDDAFILSGSAAPADLEAQLQLSAAYLTAPGYRAEAEREFRKGLDAVYANLEHTASGVINDKVNSFLRSGDPRFSVPPRAEMEERTLSEVKQWLAKPLAEGYLEVSLVGDLDVDNALATVARTLGALPKRAAAKPGFADARNVKFPSGPRQKEFRFTTDIPNGAALVYWPTIDGSNVRGVRGLNVLGNMLSDRLMAKVREELGATYSPGAANVSSDAFPGYGSMVAAVELTPDQLETISALVVKIGSDLAAGAISDDEFERAKKPLLVEHEQTVRDNGYWAFTVLSGCQARPEKIEWARTRLADYEGLTKDDVQALAKKYLPADRAIAVKLIPVARTAAGAAGGGE